MIRLFFSLFQIRISNREINFLEKFCKIFVFLKSLQNFSKKFNRETKTCYIYYKYSVVY